MDTNKVKDGFLGQKMVVIPESIKKELHQNKICSSFFVTDLGFYPNAHNHYRTRKKEQKSLFSFIALKEKAI